MNKILKVLALGAMALSTTACSDFLEVNPRTQVSETEFYKTEDDMMKGLYAVMNEMQTRMPEVWSYSSLLGDESEKMCIRDRLCIDRFTGPSDLR